jgi:hypothetical protein
VFDDRQSSDEHQIVGTIKVNGWETSPDDWQLPYSIRASATAGTARSGNERLALGYADHTGECATGLGISIFYVSGPPVKTDLSTVVPKSAQIRASAQYGIELDDLWWGLDGHLHGAMSSWTCDESKRLENDKQVLASKSTSWRLDGLRWVLEGKLLSSARPLGSSCQIELTVPDCVGPNLPTDLVTDCHLGALYRADEKGRKLVSNNVFFISSPPVSR